MLMPVTYVNARIFTGEEWLDDHAVVTGGGYILSVVPASAADMAHDVIDLRGASLVPGFADLQIYGGNGKVFSLYPGTDSLQATWEYSHAGGAVCIMPTVATISPEIMLQAIQAVKDYWAQGGAGVAGLHLEGPFINPEKKGAHLEAYIRRPEAADIDWLLQHGRGVVRMITLAPECCDPALADRLLEAGIIVSAGHSNATYEEAYTAFERGIPASTHLFNAMSPLQSRAPGIVGAIYDHPRVAASVVADGVHVDFAAIRISKKIMGDRLFLITDAVEENKEGPYIYIREKDRFVSATGVLSGSRLTMLQAVRNCVEQVGIAPEEALRMASLYPARVAGLDHELGRIAPGYRAPMLILGNNWEVRGWAE